MGDSPEAGSGQAPALAEEQAALRRVAMLVARGARPEEVFAAVAAEVGLMLNVDFTSLSRYARGGDAATIVGTWARPGAARALPVGTQMELGGQNAHTLVFRTGRPTRIDDYAGASGPVADAARGLSMRSGVGVPISVEGRLWGMMFAAVTAEAGRVVSADFTSLWRYDPDGAVTAVGTWGASSPYPMPVGTWLPFGGANVHTQVVQTHRPARLDRLDEDLGPEFAPSLAACVRSGVGAPVWVEGRLWGVMIAASTGESLPADTESRLAGFTELVATAVANAEAQAALRASRA